MTDPTSPVGTTWSLEELSPRERDIAEELRHLDPHLAGMYIHAARLLPRIHEPGMVFVVAQLGREISRGVLNRLLAEEGLPTPEETELPEEMATEQNRLTIAGVLQQPPDAPAVTAWFRVPKQFSTWMKYRFPAPPPDEVRALFETLSDLLFGRVAPYFATQAELDELLAIENPSDGDIERLQRVLLRRAQRIYFFERLQHPGWLKKLADIGAFKNPPDRVVNQDGKSWSPRNWPEGRFLVRVAASDPDAVVSVIKAIPEQNANPVVWDLAAQALSAIPAMRAKAVVRHLGKGLASTPRLFPDALFHLVAHLAEGGRKEAFQLAEYLLAIPDPDSIPQGDEDDDWRFTAVHRTDWMMPRIEAFELGEFLETVLPKLEQLNAERTLQFLVGRFRRLLRLAEVIESTSSGYITWRLLRDTSGEEDVASRLFSALVEAISRFAPQGPEAARKALEYTVQVGGEVGQRLGYIVLTAAGEFLPDQLERFFSSEEAIEPALPAREVAALVRTRFRSASPAARRMFRYALLRGPDASFIHRMQEYRGEEVSEASIEEVKQDWQRDRLRWFRGEIPDELQDVATDLGMWGQVPSYRDQELAEVGSYMETGFGWGDGGESLDIQAYSPEEVVDLVKTRKEPANASYGSDARRLETALEAYAASSPEQALIAARQLLESDEPRATRQLLSGIRQRIEREETIPWTDLLEVVTQTFARTSEDAPSTAWDEWVRAGGDLLYLLDAACNRNVLPRAEESRLWEAIETAVMMSHGWPAPEEVTATKFDQLLGILLGSAPARLVSSVVSAGLWSYRRRKDAGDGTSPVGSEPLGKLIGRLLDSLLSKDGSRLAVEAAVGRWVPQLHLLAREWLMSNASQLFEHGAEDPLNNPAWLAYLTSAPMYREIFDELHPWYVLAAQQTLTGPISDDDDFSPFRSLTRHVLHAYLNGLVKLGDAEQIVENTFNNAPASEVGNTYWRVFRGWSDSTTPLADVMVQRLLSFWEWRLEQISTAPDSPETIEEARLLGWFMKTPFLPDAELLRLGYRTFQLSRGETKAYHDWGELGRLADVDPDQTYELVELIISGQLSKEFVHLRVGEVKPVFQKLLETVTPERKSRAVRLINRLGENGMIEFGELLGPEGTSSESG